MKNNAFAILFKDLLMAGIGWLVGFMLLNSLGGQFAEGASMLAFYAACIPFGWRWASSIISAVTLQGIGIKLLIALLLGMVAIFVVIGWDALRALGSLFSALKNLGKARAAA